MHGPYMAYVWPIYGPTFICGKLGTFTSASVFEHAHVVFGKPWPTKSHQKASKKIQENTSKKIQENTVKFNEF